MDYLLPAGAREVLIDIADANGKAIRHYSRHEKAPNPPATAPIAPRWFAKPTLLNIEAGSHRFVWDLRYGRSGVPDSGDDDGDEEQRWLGPLVLPGTYHVRLSVDGQVFTASVKVAMDPRSNATPAILGQQFEWGLKSFTQMIAARQAVAEVQGLQTKLNEAKERSAGKTPDVIAAMLALRKKSTDLLTGSGHPDEGLQAMSRGMTIALNAIENADRPPTSQVIALYRLTAERLKPKLSAWQAIKGSELIRLNELLQAEGISPIQIAKLEQQAEESLAQ